MEIRRGHKTELLRSFREACSQNKPQLLQSCLQVACTPPPSQHTHISLTHLPLTHSDAADAVMSKNSL